MAFMKLLLCAAVVATAMATCPCPAATPCLHDAIGNDLCYARIPDGGCGAGQTNTEGTAGCAAETCICSDPAKPCLHNGVGNDLCYARILDGGCGAGQTTVEGHPAHPLCGPATCPCPNPAKPCLHDGLNNNVCAAMYHVHQGTQWAQSACYPGMTDTTNECAALAAAPAPAPPAPAPPAPAPAPAPVSTPLVVADASKDGMKCGTPAVGSNRVFDLRSSNANENACIAACENDENCVAFSGIMGSWCIGCSVDLDSAHGGAIAYKKNLVPTVSTGTNAHWEDASMICAAGSDLTTCAFPMVTSDGIAGSDTTGTMTLTVTKVETDTSTTTVLTCTGPGTAGCEDTDVVAASGFNFDATGYYTFTYTAVDSYGNSAEDIVFSLFLDDWVAPIIAPNPNSLTVQACNTACGGTCSTVAFQAMTATDNVNGDVSNDITYSFCSNNGTVLPDFKDMTLATTQAQFLIEQQHPVNLVVHVKASDSAGVFGQGGANNIAHQSYTFNIVDNIAPVITVTSPSVNTWECAKHDYTAFNTERNDGYTFSPYGQFADPGATFFDQVTCTQPVNTITSTVDTKTIGTYSVTYEASGWNHVNSNVALTHTIEWGHSHFGTVSAEASNDELHEVRCCSDVSLAGYVKRNSNRDLSGTYACPWGESNIPVCEHASTWADATAQCQASGGRLCTADELRADCTRGSGCGHDRDQIWSSSARGVSTPTTTKVCTGSCTCAGLGMTQQSNGVCTSSSTTIPTGYTISHDAVVSGAHLTEGSYVFQYYIIDAEGNTNDCWNHYSNRAVTHCHGTMTYVRLITVTDNLPPVITLHDRDNVNAVLYAAAGLDNGNPFVQGALMAEQSNTVNGWVIAAAGCAVAGLALLAVSSKKSALVPV